MQNKGVILDSFEQIASVFEQNNVKKPFVCCGKSFEKTKIFEYLKQFDIVVFDNIRPNPRFEDMVDASRIFVEEGCDFIIGAGGGSPIDSAKMIRLMATNDVSTCLTEPMENNDIPLLYGIASLIGLVFIQTVISVISLKFRSISRYDSGKPSILINKGKIVAIDTPESTNEIEYYGKESSEFTCNSLKNAKTITLEYENNKKDKYDRTLAWIFVDDKLLQSEIIKN